MYKCPNCGGEIEFLPESGIIKCQYCGSEFSPEQDLAGKRKNAEEQKVSQEEYGTQEGRIYTCSQCGASLYTTEETGVTFCSYCGSQAFLESRIKGEDNVLPDLIIPFQISKEQCQQIYKNKIRSAWFLPPQMKKDNTIDKFRGIYMPCWVYTGEAWADGDYTGTTTSRKGMYDEIRTYSVKAQAHGTYGGYIEDSSSSFPDGIMREISPFSLKSARQFNDRYMAGFYADIGNVPSDVYHDKVLQSIGANVKKSLSTDREIRGKGVTSAEINASTSMKTRISDVQKGFLPVWFLSNRNERTGKMSYAVINGLNGKIHTDLPVDMKKYFLVALAIAIPVFLLLQFFTMKPGILLAITMFLLALLMFTSTRMIREAYIQEHGLDDAGLQYLQNKALRHEAPDSAQEQYSAADPGQKKKGKAAGAVKRTSFGCLCFLVIPFISLAISTWLGKNLMMFGLIIGITLFIVVVCTGIFDNGVNRKAANLEPGKRIRIPFGIMLRSIMLPLIGVLAGIIVMIAAPAHDAYYYGVSVLCCIMLILSVLDYMRSLNRLSLRKPAQLGKRGGDEND